MAAYTAYTIANEAGANGVAMGVAGVKGQLELSNVILAAEMAATWQGLKGMALDQFVIKSTSQFFSQDPGFIKACKDAATTGSPPKYVPPDEPTPPDSSPVGNSGSIGAISEAIRTPYAGFSENFQQYLGLTSSGNGGWQPWNGVIWEGGGSDKQKLEPEPWEPPALVGGNLYSMSAGDDFLSHQEQSKYDGLSADEVLDKLTQEFNLSDMARSILKNSSENWQVSNEVLPTTADEIRIDQTFSTTRENSINWLSIQSNGQLDGLAPALSATTEHSVSSLISAMATFKRSNAEGESFGSPGSHESKILGQIVASV